MSEYHTIGSSTLMRQMLILVAFRSSAKSLESESGIALEHTSIVSFRKAVLSGDWKNAERLLVDGLKFGARRLAAGSKSAAPSADVSSVLRDPQSKGLDVSALLLRRCDYRRLALFLLLSVNQIPHPPATLSGVARSKADSQSTFCAA